MPSVIAYQLDILGGLQFENLIQELLFGELGLGVELRGGSSDRGKDAYCDSDLNFANRRVARAGPFIFQCKFIAGASAAGAKFEKELLGAAKKEVEEIEKRVAARKWKSPKHYCFSPMPR